MTTTIVLAVAVVVGIASRIYRISVEEEILKEDFGEAYKTYSNRIWKLIPVLF